MSPNSGCSAYNWESNKSPNTRTKKGYKKSSISFARQIFFFSNVTRHNIQKTINCQLENVAPHEQIISCFLSLKKKHINKLEFQ